MSQALLVSNLALWVCVVVLAGIVLALVRQIGLLHERIAPAGALMTGAGPTVGEPAPVLDVTTLDGRALQVGSVDDQGRATLLFFLSPTCPVCKTLLPTLLRVASDETPSSDGGMRVILASDGEPAEHAAFAGKNRLDHLPYVLSPALGMTYRIGKLPYAVLIDRHGIVRARGLVNTREHLESLFEAERQGVASVQEYVGRQSPERAAAAATASASGDGGSDEEQAA